MEKVEAGDMVIIEGAEYFFDQISAKACNKAQKFVNGSVDPCR